MYSHNFYAARSTVGINPFAESDSLHKGINVPAVGQHSKMLEFVFTRCKHVFCREKLGKTGKEKPRKILSTGFIS